MLRAVVFDFDGLILDTETPEFTAWTEIYRAHGCELSLEEWVVCIGTGYVFNPFELLQERSGKSLDEEAVQGQRRARRDELIALEKPLPGVIELIETAQTLELKLGVASSSSREWVVGHLRNHGLDGLFSSIKTLEDVTHVKPDPALYRLSVEALGVAAGEAVALEDSLNGLRSARAAGMRTVAVPNPMTRGLPLREHADLLLESLEEFSLEHF